MSAPNPWDSALAQSIIDGFQGINGAMLPILHRLQHEFGYVDRSVIPQIADALNVSKAEVLGVLTFYHDFREEPAKGRVIKLCRAEACQASGCEGLVQHARQQHHLQPDGGANAAGVAIETVFCLGNCALGPAAMVDGHLIGHLNRERLSALCQGAAVEDVLVVEHEA